MRPDDRISNIRLPLPEGKKAYTAPSLVEYGAVSKLTQERGKDCIPTPARVDCGPQGFSP